MFRNILRISLVAVAAVALFTACRKRPDVALPDNLAYFETAAQGITAAENSITVKVKLTRGTDKDIPVTITFTPQNAAYGTDLTTVPVATNNSLTVTIPQGNNEASFTVNKVANVLYDGDEKVNFE